MFEDVGACFWLFFKNAHYSGVIFESKDFVEGNFSKCYDLGKCLFRTK